METNNLIDDNCYFTPHLLPQPIISPFDVMPLEFHDPHGDLDHAVELLACYGHGFLDELDPLCTGFDAGNGGVEDGPPPATTERWFGANSNSSSASGPGARLPDAPASYGDNCDSHEDGDSSGTTGTMAGPEEAGRDRGKTLVSERKRRGRMKEMLYELRSLVPNITKMDKASIIGDAVIYVKDLQEQAKRLAEEIEELERHSAENIERRFPDKNPAARTQAAVTAAATAKGNVVELTTVEVGNRRFHVRVECTKGERVPAALYAAVESLSSLNVESSNLSSATDRYALTFTLNIGESGEEVNAQNLRLWVMTALLSEGFEFVINPV